MTKFILIFLLQGYLMAATLLKRDINGIEVPIILEHDSRLPLTTVEFIFKDSGAVASSKAGLVSLAADLLNEGTKKEGTAAFSKELENRAISFSANSGNETFAFTIDTIKEQLDFAVERATALLKDPNYTEQTFQKIVDKRVATLIKKSDDFDYIAGNGIRALLFEKSNFALPKLGTQESIKALTLKDLKNYIENHIRINNLIVVAAGDIDEKKIKALTTQFAAALKVGSVKPLPKVEASSKELIKEVSDETKQAYIYFGAPYNMEVNASDRYIGKIASFILGSGGFGSRLMEEIRVKKGLAYSAYSRFAVNRTNSYFSGYLQTKISNQKEAVDTVKEVVADFVKNGVTKEELESAKKFFLGSEPLRVETLNQRANRAFNEYYSGQGLGYSKKELALIEKLTLKELNDFIHKHSEILKMSFFIVTKK